MSSTPKTPTTTAAYNILRVTDLLEHLLTSNHCTTRISQLVKEMVIDACMYIQRCRATRLDNEAFTLVTPTSHHKAHDDYEMIYSVHSYDVAVCMGGVLRRQYVELAISSNGTSAIKLGCSYGLIHRCSRLARIGLESKRNWKKGETSL